MKNLIILLFVIVILVVFQFFLGKEAMLALAGAFFLASVAIGGWLSLEQYRLKLESEKVETDIELLTLFTKLMSIAHGRSGYMVSEKIVEKMFERKVLENAQDLSALRERLADAAIVTFPVGKAEQDAAIAAIAKSAGRHEILRDVAIEGLRTLSTFGSELAKKYVKKLTNTNVLS